MIYASVPPPTLSDFDTPKPGVNQPPAQLKGDSFSKCPYSSHPGSSVTSRCVVRMLLHLSLFQKPLAVLCVSEQAREGITRSRCLCLCWSKGKSVQTERGSGVLSLPLSDAGRPSGPYSSQSYPEIDTASSRQAARNPGNRGKGVCLPRSPAGSKTELSPSWGSLTPPYSVPSSPL